MPDHLPPDPGHDLLDHARAVLGWRLGVEITDTNAKAGNWRVRVKLHIDDRLVADVTGPGQPSRDEAITTALTEALEVAGWYMGTDGPTNRLMPAVEAAASDPLACIICGEQLGGVAHGKHAVRWGKSLAHRQCAIAEAGRLKRQGSR